MNPASPQPASSGTPESGRAESALTGRSILDAPPQQRSVRATAAGSLASIAFHLGLVGLAFQLATLHPRPPRRVAAVTKMFDVALPAPPPPAEPAPPPPAEAVKPPPKASHPIKAPPAAPPPAAEPPPKAAAPPPSAAETGKLLQADDAIDFGDKFVSGDSSHFAGGQSASTGSSNKAVHDVRAQANGVIGGTGNGLGPDRSRAPQLAEGLRWDIPFPLEADDAAVNHAQVTLRVSVGADGSVASVSVLKDPGFGFGREARRFALTRRWQPGRDRGGNTIAATTTVNVSFDR